MDFAGVDVVLGHRVGAAQNTAVGRGQHGARLAGRVQLWVGDDHVVQINVTGVGGSDGVLDGVAQAVGAVGYNLLVQRNGRVLVETGVGLGLIGDIVVVRIIAGHRRFVEHKDVVDVGLGNRVAAFTDQLITWCQVGWL